MKEKSINSKIYENSIQRRRKVQSKKSEKITFDRELSTKKIEINKSALKNPQIK